MAFFNVKFFGRSFQASIPAFLHTSAILEKSLKSHKEPKQWLKYNDIVYPPQSLSEERRPAVRGFRDYLSIIILFSFSGDCPSKT